MFTQGFTVFSTVLHLKWFLMHVSVTLYSIHSIDQGFMDIFSSAEPLSAKIIILKCDFNNTVKVKF